MYRRVNPKRKQTRKSWCPAVRFISWNPFGTDFSGKNQVGINLLTWDSLDFNGEFIGRNIPVPCQFGCWWTKLFKSGNGWKSANIHPLKKVGWSWAFLGFPQKKDDTFPGCDLSPKNVFRSELPLNGTIRWMKKILVKPGFWFGRPSQIVPTLISLQPESRCFLQISWLETFRGDSGRRNWSRLARPYHQFQGLRSLWRSVGFFWGVGLEDRRLKTMRRWQCLVAVWGSYYPVLKGLQQAILKIPWTLPPSLHTTQFATATSRCHQRQLIIPWGRLFLGVGWQWEHD